MADLVEAAYGAAGGAGSPGHVGWAYSAARGLTASSTVWGAGEAAVGVSNGNHSIFNYLALAGGAGFLAGRFTRGLGLFQCFTGDTAVVRGWQPITETATPPAAAIEGATPVAHQWNAAWFATGAGLLLATGTARAIVNRRKNNSTRQKSNSTPEKNGTTPEDEYFCRDIFDDLHRTDPDGDDHSGGTRDRRYRCQSRHPTLTSGRIPENQPSVPSNSRTPDFCGK